MSGIVFQFSIIIGGVITILIGLVLSDVILQGVAGASTYEADLAIGTPQDVWENCMDGGTQVDNGGNTGPLRASIDNADCNLSGFMGSEAVLFLLPIVYYLFIIAIGLGMIGAGSLGVVGRGPTAGAGAR